MQPRITPNSLFKNCPRIVTHLTALGDVPESAALPKKLQHLVKLRVSQLNGCGYCQHMHSNEAREDGETQARLDTLPAWRELSCFSSAEKAALAWAEALTLLANSRIDNADFMAAQNAFGERALMDLTSIILQINSWNRISVGFHFQPEFI
jgi:AhpD family alkylhydroperoxidase